MKLIINRVSVCFNKNPKEFFFLDKDTCVSEYTINNPKLVDCCDNFKGMETFTGVVKDVYGVAHYVNGKLHRDNGPAIQDFNGSKGWYANGKLHRTDGPAYESVTGNRQWCFNNKIYGLNDAFTNESWIAFVATLK